MTLNNIRLQSACKTALGVVIVYGIALQLNWPKPNWAAMTVVMLAQTPHLGTLLENGIFRVLGTIAGAATGLIIAASFLQDRLWFIIIMSLVITICLYAMQNNRRPFTWFASALTALLVALSTQQNPNNGYSIALFRLSEVSLGVLVSLLLNSLLWPRPAGKIFKAQLVQTMTYCHDLFTYKMHLLCDTDNRNFSGFLIEKKLFATVTQLRQTFNAALFDTTAIRRFQHNYQLLIDHLIRLGGMTIALGEAIKTTQTNPISALTESERQTLKDTMSITARLLSELPQALDEPTAGHYPDAFIEDLKTVRNTLRSLARSPALNHHDPLEVAVFHAMLDKLRTLTEHLFHIRQTLIKLENTPIKAAVSSDMPTPPLMTRLRCNLPKALMAGTAFAGVMILWILTDWPGIIPAGAMFAVLIVTLSITIPFPWAPRRILFGTSLGALLALSLHFWVLPSLDSFVALSLLLFPLFMTLSYLSTNPNPAIGFLFSFATIVTTVMLGVQTTPNYQGINAIHGCLGILGGLGVGLLVISLFARQTPEQKFQHHAALFFQRGTILLQTLMEKPLWRPSLRHVFMPLRRAMVMELLECQKLAGQLNYQHFPENNRQNVEQLLDSMTALLFRLAALVMVRRDFDKYPDIAPPRELRRRVRRCLRDAFADLYNALEYHHPPPPPPNLSSLTQALLSHVDGIMPLRYHQDIEVRRTVVNVLIATGYYQALREALCDCHQQLRQLDWKAWEQEYFA